ncbi:FtsX-like permease family protein [Actinocrispum sp. NPDC049592]|uniref:FtsX-like permease family protein n=1 Tax=Actinocrispum sp. NPDC049592 TaxID=3154835 RepID=UPI00341D5DF8
MLRIALSTLRFRKASFAASFLALFAGAAIVMACGGLLESGLRSSAPQAERLRILAGVFSGWTAVIVIFGVSSMIGLTVQHRHRELALLRAIGTTPRQIRRLVLGETMVLAVLATVLAYLPSRLLSRFMVQELAPPVPFRLGWLPGVIGATDALLAAVGAALIAGRRASRIPAIAVLTESDVDTRRLSRPRLAAALSLIVVGLSLGVFTMVAMDGPYAASTAGPASILVAMGLALLVPGVVRRIAFVLPEPTAQQARVQFRRMAAVTVPVVLATGIGLGTLYMQATEDSMPQVGMGETLRAGNYAVVGMILGFAVLTIVNALAASATRRRGEFGLVRLAGSTRSQVLRSMGVEALVVTAVGVTLGGIASLATILPFSLARTGSAFPAGSPVILLAVIGAAALVTVAATLVPTWRVLRKSPRDLVGRA